MSIETTNASSDLDQDSVLDQDKSKDVVAYESHAKLLKQKKARDQEVLSLKSQIDQLQEGKDLADGNKDKVIEAQRSKITELEKRTIKQENAYGWNIVSGQIESALLDKGVRNPKKALAYARATMSDEIALLRADDNYNIEKEDVGRFVDTFLSGNSDMGFVGPVSVSDTNPSNSVLPAAEKVTLEKATPEQLDELLLKSM
jgi:hypothetical protein